MGQAPGSLAGAQWHLGRKWVGDAVFCATCRDPGNDWAAPEERIDVNMIEDNPLDGGVKQPLQGAPSIGGSRSSLSLDPDRMSMSMAKKRLKGAIEAVKAVNRMAKTVRFSEESVVCFEVHSEGSEALNGLAMGDKVVWSDADDDVPKGSVGEVTGFSAGGIVQVRFPKGTWDFRAQELSHQDTWATSVARNAIVKAEKLMRDLQVLEAEAILAEALMRLEEVVALEKFEQAQCPDDHQEDMSQASVDSSGSRSQHSVISGARPDGSNSGSLRGNHKLERSGSGLSGTRSPGTRRASLLSQTEAADARAAIFRMQETAVFKDVSFRVGQYQALGRLLAPEGFQLAWESNVGQLWVHAPSGRSWFELRLVCDLGDASLAQCLAYAHELDLRSKYEPRLAEAPQFLGPISPLVVVTRALTNILVFRVELILEKFRWYNVDFGFFAESLRSSVPAGALDLPKRSWRNRRVTVNGQNLWIPRGGGEKGTIAVQLARVEPGSRVARCALSSCVSRAAPGLCNELRSAVARVRDPSGPYPERLAGDKQGFYARLEKVEAAAAKRPAASAAALPGEDIFRRAFQLPSTWP